MTDVSARLRALAQDVAAQHAAGPGLPLEEVTARARRGRARRTAWIAGAAAAVVVAIAVGGAALGRPVPAPVPAVSPTATPTSTPTPSPTAAGTVLPMAAPGAPFGVCGSLVGSAPAHPVEPALFVELDELPGTLAVGDPLPYRMSLGADAEGTLVRRVAGPQVVVTHGDVVVAVTDPYGGARPDDWTVQEGWTGVAVHVGAASLTVCDAPGATAGAPLPAGEYGVWLVAEAALTGDGLDRPDGPPAPDQLRTLVHGPMPLTLVGDAPSGAPVPTDAPFDSRLPTSPQAQSAPPPAPTTSGPWRLTHSSGPVVVDAADLASGAGSLDLTATLTYDGPGRTTLYGDVVLHLWLVRDDRVVATTYLPGDRHRAVIDLGPGHGIQLRTPGLPLVECATTPGDPGCWAGGGEVPPGEYTLLPGFLATDGSLWTPADGVQPFTDLLGAHPDIVVLGDPVPLTVR